MKNATNYRPMTYFANLPQDEIGDEILRRIEQYRNYLRTDGRLWTWRRCYEMYYHQYFTGGRLYRTGQNAEYNNISVNHFRNLLLHLKSMTTQSRPAFEPRATNTDQKSQQQTILASGLLDYYQRAKRLDFYLDTACELGLLFGEGFVIAEWDPTSGQTYGVNPETKAPIYEGDLVYSNTNPIWVARDWTKSSVQEHEWYIVTTHINRYTLMAKYPELAEDIRRLPSRSVEEKDFLFYVNAYEETDDVAVHTLYHRKTAAVPEGRMVRILDKDLVVMDTPMPYRNLPIHRLAPDEQLESPFGYTVAFDLMPVQENYDMLTSTILTNQSAFGVQNIMAPKGSGVILESLSNGMSLIEYDKALGPPQPLNLVQTSPEIFQFLTMLERLQETISGVNSVARGNPDANLKSGSALALVQSMAIQFSNTLQQSYTNLVQDVGTATINILRDMAQVPRVATIVGKSNRSAMRNFTGDDLDQINRVEVDSGNPLTKTTAGRVDLAQTLIQNKLIDTPQQYIMVLKTGNLEPLIEDEESELLLIRAENEEMADGHPQPVLITDDHQLHIQSHMRLLHSPEARKDAGLIQVLTNHIMAHKNQLQNGDPELLQLMRQTPIPKMPPQNQGGLPAPQQGQAGALLNATNPVTQEAAKVQQPKMPISPLQKR